MLQAARRLCRQLTRVLTLVLPLMCGVGTALAAFITFEENRGQVSPEVAFLSRTARYRLYLTRRGAVVTLHNRQAVRIRLEHSKDTAPVGTHLLIAKTNYLVGNDPARWKKGIANYGGVRYPQVYPGVDVTWHAHDNELEQDFLVAAGADTRRIRLKFSGAALRLTSEGDLMAGALRLHRPRAYQGGREVDCRYEMDGPSVRFALGRYDHSQALTIDPVLSFSTFLGGTNDTNTPQNPAQTTAVATALDAAGHVYVAGTTSSLDFPTTAGAFEQTTLGGICGYSSTPKGGSFPIPCSDAFIAEFSGDGSTLLNSTYLGGPEADVATGLAVGRSGDVYLLGGASLGFPKLAPLAGQTIPNATTSFVAKLSADLSSLQYATAVPLIPKALAVDAAGAVYLTGSTTGQLPTVNALQPMSRDGGSFFKTTDNGNHWQSVPNLPPGVAFIVADPTNPQVLYTGGSVTSGPGSLNKTTDGGVHWTSIRNGIDPASLPSSLVIDSRSPQTLYLGVFTPGPPLPGLYKSMDGGATWTSSANGIGNSVSTDVSTLALDPANSSTLYAGTYTGLYKSTDAAGTWSRTSLTVTYASPPQRPVAPVLVDPTSANTLYTATADGIVKSLDGGATWNRITIGFTPGSSILALAMDRSGPQTLYAAGNNFVYKTTDGGAHWNPTPWPLQQGAQGGLVQSLMIDPQLHSRIWAAVSDGVFVSPDAGASWTRTSLPHLSVPSLAADGAGSIYALGNGGPFGDAFVMKLDPTGSNLVYSTYLGGMGADVGGGIAVDATGRAYIVGETDSPDFPLAAPLQPNFGGQSDVFVSVLDPAGAHLVWSTYLGGSAAEGATSIAIDPAGNVHLSGAVSPNSSLVTPFLNQWPTEDAFAAKIKGDGSALIFSTRLGGSNFDQASSVAADAAGNTYIAGSTGSPDLPTLNAVQSTHGGPANSGDAFVAEFDGQTGALRYSTYLGGSQTDRGNALAVDAVGNAYVVGQTSSPDFPLQSPFQSSLPTASAFVAKLAAQGPTLGMIGLTNAASYNAAVAPGELVSLFGANLAASVDSASQLPLPNQLSDVQVTVNGVPAPLVYVSPQQINAQLPYEIQPGPAQLQVSSSAGTSTITMNVGSVAPAIFTLNQQGTGPGAILHGLTYQVVNGSNPAGAGEILSIYCTGLGAVNPPAQSGSAPPSPPPQTATRVQVSIAGVTAPVTYAGVAPGFPGLYQVNAQVPAGTLSGAQPLQMIQNGVASNTVTVAVQ